ncbi:MAG TPA: NEAT domain-containing protein, partial [Candidatus Dorea intestinavium]|nr:NEAT domain-containing protein [Candidatus Dorea intestinavium]
NANNTTTTTLDKDNLAPGIYEVPVELFNATKDEASMAASSIKDYARIQVTEGVYNMYVYTQSMSMGSINATLQYLQVEDGAGGFSQASIGTKDASGNPASFVFAMPHKNEFLSVKVNPMVEMMGNQYIDARLKINWSGLKKADGNTDLKSAPTATSGSAKTGAASVKTGDAGNTSYYLLMLMGAAMIMLVSFKKRKMV